MMEIVPSTQDDVEFIHKKMTEFNQAQVEFTSNKVPIFKNYVMKEKSGNVIAGIHACIYHWGILNIYTLIVDEGYRRKKLGSQLLQYVEKQAVKEGAYLSQVDTFDFQAKDFYLKQGYEIFGVLENCPPGHKRYYLKKYL